MNCSRVSNWIERRCCTSTGPLRLGDLEIAQDTEDDAKTTLDTATEHLRLLGSDPNDPKGIVDILAPVSGVITDQEVTNGASVQAYSAPNPFTISDLTTVWIVCDVYENDMANVHVGQPADIKLNAYPDKVLKGTISNIGSILDPNIRTAKVRIEVANPGEMMRPGMFATATLFGKEKQTFTAVPASAIVHLHDRDWVFIPVQEKFKRIRSSVANSCRTRCRRFYPGCSRASRSCQTRSISKMRSTMNDAQLWHSRKKR